MADVSLDAQGAAPTIFPDEIQSTVQREAQVH
jgi:hypothetical protein